MGKIKKPLSRVNKGFLFLVSAKNHEPLVTKIITCKWNDASKLGDLSDEAESCYGNRRIEGLIWLL